MRLLLLGSGGFHPSESRHTACLLLPEIGVMLDAGTAAFRVARHVATPRLDIYLTHAHLDHVIGLTYLIGLEHAGQPVETVVHAAPAVLRVVRERLLDPALFPIDPVTRYVELGRGDTLPGGGSLRAFPLTHPGGSLGLRIESGGKSFAYVTDTTRLAAGGLEAIRGVDLLLHEAHFTEAQRDLADLTGHSTAADAAWAAAEAGAGRLVMIHRDPRCDDEAAALSEARAIYPSAEFGVDSQVIEL